MKHTYERFVELINDSNDKRAYTEFILELFCYCVMSDKVQILNKNNFDNVDQKFTEQIDYYIEQEYLFNTLVNGWETKRTNLSEQFDEAFTNFSSNKLNEQYLSLFKTNLKYIDRENIVVHAALLIEDIYSNGGLEEIQQVFNQLLNFYIENDVVKTDTYAPSEITALLTQIVIKDKQQPENVYDPSCGSGNFLVSVAQKYPEIKVYGQEKNLTQYRLSMMNLIINDVTNFDLRLGDALEEDIFSQEQFDISIANPPYSTSWSGEWMKQFEPFHTLSPKSKADYAFVQQMLYHLKESGTMAIMLPLGALFRSGNEQRIRKELVDELNYLDAVIQLPENLFFSTAISTCILIARKNRKREENVLFIDASNEFEKGRSRNLLNKQHVEHIIETYRDRKSENKFSYLATLEEIASKDYDLSLSRYVDRFEESKELNLKKLEDEISKVDSEIIRIEQQIKNYYKILEGKR
ncbi:type I restriction-modification system subunit M [Candidatus Enterococcus ikei]|uniref:site-specific DNA-methyltransferase (adenine-specific) n=1 Tax=Candidatus Enterococcus ikei TaxID=2815326 RepID=A0ABS3GWG4_9ENTE|nr:type I restriction-modification system subunit M [Enterococcus sp. DIV0869a]MBO0439618.1 type I restriction-modification system subunit M [Enterococcus sp. DIV0869a]